MHCITCLQHTKRKLYYVFPSRIVASDFRLSTYICIGSPSSSLPRREKSRTRMFDHNLYTVVFLTDIPPVLSYSKKYKHSTVATARTMNRSSVCLFLFLPIVKLPGYSGQQSIVFGFIMLTFSVLAVFVLESGQNTKPPPQKVTLTFTLLSIASSSHCRRSSSLRRRYVMRSRAA